MDGIGGEREQIVVLKNCTEFERYGLKMCLMEVTNLCKKANIAFIEGYISYKFLDFESNVQRLIISILSRGVGHTFYVMDTKCGVNIKGGRVGYATSTRCTTSTRNTIWLHSGNLIWILCCDPTAV
jgi:hypothetical protein